MKDIRDIAILDHLRASRAASVTDLAAATGSSVATIRRDLQRLDDAGLLRRTHGGAVITEAHEGDAPFPEVETKHRDEKRRIAEAAAALVQDGHTVVLDIGTTVLQLALQLRGRPISVITANMAVFEALKDDHAVHLVLLPGDYDPVYHSVSGPLTTDSLRLIRADHAFLGVSGISASGDLRDTTIAQVPIKQAIALACDEVTVLADSSKFPGTGAARIDLPSSIVRVVTDDEPPVPIAAAFAAHGVEVLVT